MPLMPRPAQHKAAGFTLIELIITMIIMSFAAIIITPYLTAVTHSPDPLLREQAIALGQAMMDEILAKRWDENSPNGGGPICTSESTNHLVDRASLDPACTYGVTDPQASLAADLGRDPGESANANDRKLWDDVDDYAFLTLSGTNYEQDNFWDQDGAGVISMPGFSRGVDVHYIPSSTATISATSPASAPAPTDSKRIVVTVRSPLGETFEFVAVSCNF